MQTKKKIQSSPGPSFVCFAVVTQSLLHLWTRNTLLLTIFVSPLENTYTYTFFFFFFEIPAALCSVLPPTNMTYGGRKSPETDKRLTYPHLITLL